MSFQNQKRQSLCARGILLFLFVFSLTAELWSNNKPLLMSYQHRIYTPLIFQYQPTEFGLSGRRMTVDYRDPIFSSSDWALWPVNPWGPYEVDRAPAHFPSAPDSRHWLGTDDRGRDVFARLLYGFRTSFIYALMVWGLASLLASLVGAASGYFGATVDLLGQRVVEILSTVPQFLLLIFLISIWQPGLALLACVTAVLSWMGLSRYVRSEALRCRKLEFVQAAQTLGASHWYILRRHILPNALSPLISFAPFVIAAHMIGLAALSYLGFGPPPPEPSWGEILQQGQKYFGMAWWLTVFPTLAFFVTLISLTLASLGVRERERVAC